jgi:hypothetical protein
MKSLPPNMIAVVSHSIRPNVGLSHELMSLLNDPKNSNPRLMTTSSGIALESFNNGHLKRFVANAHYIIMLARKTDKPINMSLITAMFKPILYSLDSMRMPYYAAN